jgi:hypothetical protein
MVAVRARGRVGLGTQLLDPLAQLMGAAEDVGGAVGEPGDAAEGDGRAGAHEGVHGTFGAGDGGLVLVLRRRRASGRGSRA